MPCVYQFHHLGLTTMNLKEPRFYAVRTPYGLIQRFAFTCEGVRCDFTSEHLHAARVSSRDDAEGVARMCNGKVVQWKKPKPEDVIRAMAEESGQ